MRLNKKMAALSLPGGVIKLTEKMIGDQYDIEVKKLKRVRDYLKSQGIFSKEGLEAI
jgi:hypothetical protein